MDETQVIQVAQNKSLFKKILFGILLLTTFLTPIFFLPMKFASVQLSTSLLFATGVIMAIVIYTISSLFSGTVDLPKKSKYVIGSIALVPLIYVLAGVVNGFSQMSFFGYSFDINAVGFILLGFAYLYLVSILFKDKSYIFYAYFTFLISSIILSIFLLVRIFFGASVLSFGIFTTLTSSTIGSWSNVGIFFGIGALLSLLTYEMVSVGKFMKILLTVALLLSLFFLALVNFSLIWIILAVCSFLFILYKIFSPDAAGSDYVLKGKLSKIPLYSVIVLIISLVFIFGGAGVDGYLSAHYKISDNDLKPSFADTMIVARNTLSEHPLFGSGSNTFTFDWLKWKPDSVANTPLWNIDFTNGSGLIPTFLATTGIIGLLSWLIFLFFYIFLGIKSIFTRFEDSFIKYLITSSFFISLYLWIMCLVHVPSEAIFILTFFFTGLFFASVYLSGIIVVEKIKLSQNPKVGFLTSFVMVGLLVASVFLGYGLFKNGKALWYFQKSAELANVTGDIDGSESKMLEAIKIVPNDIYYRSLAEIELLKLNAVASLDPKKIKVEDIQKQFNDVLTNAITAAKSAQTTDTNNYLNWVSLGRVYESISAPELKIDGAYESSQFAYTEALKLNPKNPGILLFLSRLAVTHKDYNQARIYAEQAIKIKSDYLDAYFLLSQIEVSSNNISAAIKSVTSASVIDPTNPAIFFQLGLLKYNLQDFGGAMTALQKAIAISPDYANAKYFLGLSYESVGEHAKALKEFQDILTTNPDSQEVKDIISKLEAGKSIFATSTKPEKADSLPIKVKGE